MALLARGWSLSDGNVVGTVTYTYDSPWTTYTYLHTISSQVVTPPSPGPPTGMAQGQTQSSDTTCTTTTSTSAHAATAPSMTLTLTSGMQTQTGTDYASTTSPTAYPTSLADESASASASASGSASERGASLSSGASFGVVSPSPALTHSSSAGQPAIPTGSSGNAITSASSGRGMGKGAIAAIALAVVLAVALGGAVLCWVCRRRRRGGRRRESSFIQYPFLWRSDAASAVASMSEAPSRALTPTPAATPTPAEWDTFGERDEEVAESARTGAATVTSSTGAPPGYGGGLVLGDEKSSLPPVATGPSLRFSAAFPLSSPVSLSPATADPATSPSTPLALAPPPAAHAHDADVLPSPASTVPYGYAWDHPPSPLPSSGGRRQSSGTVSVSYSTAMADSEVGSRPPSYSRY